MPAGKVYGGERLLYASTSAPLAAFQLFSSLAAFSGAAGQATYASGTLCRTPCPSALPCAVQIASWLCTCNMPDTALLGLPCLLWQPMACWMPGLTAVRTPVAPHWQCNGATGEEAAWQVSSVASAQHFPVCPQSIMPSLGFYGFRRCTILQFVTRASLSAWNAWAWASVRSHRALITATSSRSWQVWL